MDSTPRNLGHYAKGTQNAMGSRLHVITKEKMLLCKQAEKGVQLQAEQSDWLADTEQSESISNTCVVETGDRNVIPDSPDMCDNDIQDDQNDVECDDERVALANLIANLKLDVDENKKIQKQLKKANATLTQELTECKSILAETIDYDKLERKLNETLGLLAQKEIDIKEGLKVKAYEISVVKEKHDELVKQSLLTKSHYEGLVKEKTKVITVRINVFLTYSGELPTWVMMNPSSMFSGVESTCPTTAIDCFDELTRKIWQFMWCAHGCLIFIMESMDLIRLLEVCSWLYDVYEEAVGVIDIGLIFNHGAIDVYRLWI
ncbi:hypothetical protein Tco_1158173 [Tanacetum coccineum]